MNAFRSNGAASRMDFLPPERRGRPASARAVPKRSDIVDAEFETVVSPGRRHVYPVFNDNRARPAAQSGASARSVASAFGWVVNHVERLLQTASPKAFAVLVTCLCAPVFVLFASLPQYQPAIPSAPALSISDVTHVAQRCQWHEDPVGLRRGRKSLRCTEGRAGNPGRCHRQRPPAPGHPYRSRRNGSGSGREPSVFDPSPTHRWKTARCRRFLRSTG